MWLEKFFFSDELHFLFWNNSLITNRTCFVVYSLSSILKFTKDTVHISLFIINITYEIQVYKKFKQVLFIKGTKDSIWNKFRVAILESVNYPL